MHFFIFHTLEKPWMNVAIGNPINKTTYYTVEQAIDKLGFGNVHLRLLLICGAWWGADAIEILLVTFLGPNIEEWNLNMWLKASIGSSTFAGLFIGTNLWGLFADRFGRKRGILFVSLVCGLFSIVSAFSPNIYVLLVLRFFLGLGIGGTSIVFTIMTEYLPSKSRGSILTNFGFFWVLGTCFEILAAYLILPIWGWRGLLLVSASPFILLIPFVFWIKETPVYLHKKGRRDEAEKVLEYLADQSKMDLPEGQLAPYEENKKEGFKTLLSPKYRKLSLLLWVIWFTSNLDYYGITLFAPHYFEVLGGGAISPKSGTFYLLLLATTLAEMPGLLACSTAVKYIGRKKVQTIALGSCSVFLFAMLADPPPIPGIILLVFARMFIAGAASTIWAYTPEAYPTAVRATGVGVAGGFAKFGSVFSPFISIVLQSYSPKYPLLVFGLLGLLSTICSFLLPFDETKNPLYNQITSTEEAD